MIDCVLAIGGRAASGKGWFLDWRVWKRLSRTTSGRGGMAWLGLGLAGVQRVLSGAVVNVWRNSSGVSQSD